MENVVTPESGAQSDRVQVTQGPESHNQHLKLGQSHETEPFACGI